jgi:hypothetical protein
VANPDVGTSVFDGKGVRSHHGQVVNKATFQGTDGGKNTYQGHDAECNNEHCKNGSEHMALDRFKRYPDVFEYKLAFHCLMQYVFEA